MPVHDDLGKRMKENYESVTKTRLVRRMPVIIRIDGKAFHTFTKGFKRPFDDILVNCMNETMLYLCEHIQGCKLGYCQSDEISLLLTDYDKLNTSAWFDNEVLKMTSISASMATVAFNQALRRSITKYKDEKVGVEWCPIHDKYYNSLIRAVEQGAMFDSRVFNIPKEEVTNYFLWRQNDATRNSIESVGQAHFSARELHKKTCNQIQDMLFKYKDINWNDFDVDKKRGRCSIKEYYWLDKETKLEVPRQIFTDTNDTLNWQNSHVMRSRWVVDNNIPIFLNEGRDYVEKFV